MNASFCRSFISKIPPVPSLVVAVNDSIHNDVTVSLTNKGRYVAENNHSLFITTNDFHNQCKSVLLQINFFFIALCTCIKLLYAQWRTYLAVLIWCRSGSGETDTGYNIRECLTWRSTLRKPRCKCPCLSKSTGFATGADGICTQNL